MFLELADKGERTRLVESGVSKVTPGPQESSAVDYKKRGPKQRWRHKQAYYQEETDGRVKAMSATYSLHTPTQPLRSNEGTPVKISVWVDCQCGQSNPEQL
ncbi:unnamed protein product [Pleuronectes platessa]|uniref:Uncharacterized protein n=1 Tax=Pleuronectes platessa TaxID=8262 RepID=A0A9N7TQK0_PLEPL|nr:unnamed protein product [Pleuronectes platessa]